MIGSVSAARAREAVPGHAGSTLGPPAGLQDPSRVARGDGQKAPLLSAAPSVRPAEAAHVGGAGRRWTTAACRKSASLTAIADVERTRNPRSGVARGRARHPASGKSPSFTSSSPGNADNRDVFEQFLRSSTALLRTGAAAEENGRRHIKERRR
jgi:hypothetical protein